MNRKKGTRKTSEYYFDYSLVFIVLFLLGFGLIMVYSASSYEASISEKLNYDAAYYLKKQLQSSLIGLVAMIVVSRIPYHFWERFAVMGYGVVGSGVVEAFYNSLDNIQKKINHNIDIKYILDFLFLKSNISVTTFCLSYQKPNNRNLYQS